MSTETCCFCIERKVGCMILAVISLLGGIKNVFDGFHNGEVWQTIVISLVIAAAAIILLIGIVQEQYRLFMPYLILQGLAVILIFLLIVIHGIVAFNSEKGILWISLLFDIIFWGLEIFFLYVVYEYRNDMSDRLPR